VRVTASGELDMAYAERLCSEVEALLERGFTDVVIDLRELTFIDSSGIQALLTCDRRARQAGGRLFVALAVGPVSRTIELCGVRDLLDVAPSA
jgi:anti-sigma B factor antagonist